MEKQDTFRAVVLIPAYKPDERLVQLTRELKEEKLDVLLVDDGGGAQYAPIFEQCRALGAEVAVHAVNQGKGRALKTGLNAALNIWPDLSGVMTADADGQHTLRDILRIIEAMRAFDHLAPGLYSKNTLLYGVEVKFYSSKITVDDKFETAVNNFFAIGDGAGITRGLMQASVTGVVVAREIANRL